MKRTLPAYIENRIRQCPPDDLQVVPGSTPVIAFGDLRKARVATLGWNPSKLEFLDATGAELVGQYRRLETLTSLANDDLASAPTEVIAKVFEACNNYFRRAPYRRRFDVLEKVLQRLDASYYDGTACHLDFVQWATNPVWRELRQQEKMRFIDADLSFLRQQIAQEHVRLLLLNGSGIARVFSKRLEVPLIQTPLEGHAGTTFVGRTDHGVQVVGWNLNLQSSFGVSNNYIASIAEAIRRLHSSP